MVDNETSIFYLSKRRFWTMFSIAILVPVGLYSKFYIGPGAWWVNNSLVGVWYVVFWCLVGTFFFENAKARLTVAVVLIVTCIVEFLQLWHPSFLEWLRRFFIGRVVLGTGFTWTDFPYYFIGALLGWFWMRRLPNSRTRGQSRRSRG
jgi:hypothetical protein